ncbi:hypothetical protein SAMN06265365_13650 [Tistlia consotensis]|uniref:Uncharacterized protein n=1 Tax=Tistlia consotensis USBA 355 TaxID=560819 RepID=A0A1Y6CUS6_9PROT|nr:hypothetical protein [Tistlia consotensis]SMF78541.1 hypothetical protein SAMN05428998_13851 [Tistlia consotensis USBA 355]SNS18676.1 hypothetical protein SAMN06265365_13650 [Tistlia consotensis]
MARTPLSIVLLVAALGLAAAEAAAFCTEPRLTVAEPQLGFASEPPVPDCLQGFGPRPPCESQELRAYRIAAERYLEQLERFARAARSYAYAAEAFAREAEAFYGCEAGALPLP